MPPAEPRPFRIAWLFGLLLVALTLLPRLWALGTTSLWMDEGFSLLLSSGSPADIVRRIIAEENHPPLYYLVLGAWRTMDGSAFWLRLPGVLCALGITFLLLSLGRTLRDEAAGRMAALLWSLNALSVMLSREVRMYPLAALLMTLATVCLLRALEREARRGIWLSCYALCLLAAALTHYIAAMVGVAQVVYVGWLAWRRAVDGRFVRSWGLALAAAALGFLPWLIAKGNPMTHHQGLLPQALQAASGGLQLEQLPGIFYDQAYGATLYFRPLGPWRFGQFYLACLVSAACLLGGVFYARRDRAWGLVAWTFLLSVGLVMAAASMGGLAIFKGRYLYPVTPLFCLLVGRFLVHLRYRLAAWALGAFLLILTTVSTFNLLAQPEWGAQDLAGATHCIASRAMPGDIVILLPSYDAVLVDFYAPTLRQRVRVVAIGPQDVDRFAPAPLEGHRIWVLRSAASLVDPAGRVPGALSARARPVTVFSARRLNPTFSVEVLCFDLREP